MSRHILFECAYVAAIQLSSCLDKMAGYYVESTSWPDSSKPGNWSDFGMAEHFLMEGCQEPQLLWWYAKVKLRELFPGNYQGLGNMLPTHLPPTPPKRARSRNPEQAKKIQDSREFPAVPLQHRLPSEVSLSLALQCLSSQQQQLDLREIQNHVKASFYHALASVTLASTMHDELCRKTSKFEYLQRKDPDAWSKIKNARLRTRDLVLWRWFGLTTWLYNHAEEEACPQYGNKIESQLMNGVAKIRQQLLQDMMLGPCWQRLENKFVECCTTGSWTPDLHSLWSRISYLYQGLRDLEGVGASTLQQYSLSQSQLEQLLSRRNLPEDEKAFEEKVWEHAGRKITNSVIEWLEIDTDDFGLSFEDV